MTLAWGGKHHILIDILALALTVKHEVQPIKAPIAIEEFQPKKKHVPDFDIEVLEPLRAEQKALADKLAAEEAERVKQAEMARQATLVAAPMPVYTPVATTVGNLMGSLGYALPGGNCVNQVPLAQRAAGNPISWAVLSYTPYIGAAALFQYNHVGIVSGIWSNGELEIRHENCPGCPTRYPRSTFRGFR